MYSFVIVCIFDKLLMNPYLGVIYEVLSHYFIWTTTLSTHVLDNL